MDITAFIHEHRSKAFLVGDYGTYRSQLSRQILSLRRKLKCTTPKNNKAASKSPVTAEEFSRDHEFGYLQILAAERAWAHAMSMKDTRADDTAKGGITGLARRHIMSRLHKAYIQASHLVSLLEGQSSAKTTDNDYLEAKAYAQSLLGSEQFERVFNKRFDALDAQQEAWRPCLVAFSGAFVIYDALYQRTRKDEFREMIGDTVEPSIRYAAYQSKISRTIATATVAKQHFPRDDSELLAKITKLQPEALDEEKAKKAVSKEGTVTDVPTSITWRGRNAPIADAAVGQAIAATTLAIQELSTQTDSLDGAAQQTALAGSYDAVLTAAQDTVDAIRQAIGELSREGVTESDSRIQNLRVSDLAANYTLISWRIGRNRVLTSNTSMLDDGLTFIPATTSKTARRAKNAAAMDVDAPAKTQAESKPHQLNRLRARVALYDSTLQSLSSLLALPGAARDTGFAAELAALQAYYSSLRLANVGYAQALLGSHAEALALFAQGAELASTIPTPSTAARTPPNMEVSASAAEALQSHLTALVTRQRGLVALHKLGGGASSGPKPEGERPLAQRLGEYPSGGVDLRALVPYPVALEPVAVKPIFLDLAWGLLKYPGQTAAKAETKAVVEEVAPGSEKKKGGWFGFGR